MKKIYINSDGNIFNGLEADELFKAKNDTMYLNDDGIIQVPLERWVEEQKYELNSMSKRYIINNDDRNFEHRDRFECYQSISDLDIINYIELGCGPFTNTRIILPNLKNVESVSLLDPLVDSYVYQSNCSYKNKKLCGYNVDIICSPIEKFNTDKKFDMVVLINVLEHCYDIPLIFDKIYNLLNSGGIFIFSEATIDSKIIKDIVYNIYDEGHALRVSTQYIKKMLNNYKEIYLKDFVGLYNQPWRHDIYFIGKKLI